MSNRVKRKLAKALKLRLDAYAGKSAGDHLMHRPGSQNRKKGYKGEKAKR